MRRQQRRVRHGRIVIEQKQQIAVDLAALGRRCERGLVVRPRRGELALAQQRGGAAVENLGIARAPRERALVLLERRQGGAREGERGRQRGGGVGVVRAL